MSSRREIRELALQALYQYEVRGEVDIEAIERSILDAPQAEAAKRQALEMAGKAWAMHEQADALGILRLGFYEIASGLTPTAVAINEAVELAKAYGSQRSPPFINGVLDKMSRHLHDRGTIAAPPADGWLDEAMRDSRPLS
jgi:transcription antitermination protein NusB